ncbi:hypothetical protein [Mitsuokella sp.]|uniref:hypothetical protein n=1 Tax=Mitsuokella sp. TaxID=2049034 RepID=UPI003D7E55C6
MEQWTMKRKKQAGCFLAGCLLLSVYFWQSGEDTGLTVSESAVSGQSAAGLEQAKKEESGSLDSGRKEQQKEHARYQKIRGMESQTTLAELRNPFSPAHEKRGEAAVAASRDLKESAGMQKKISAGPIGAGSPYRNESQTGQKAAETQPESAAQEKTNALRLSGIVQGGTPLVILTDGRQSASLTVGEHFAGWEVLEIGSQSVRLQGPAGEKWLDLTSLE